MTVRLPSQAQSIGANSGLWDRAWYEWAWRLTDAVNAAAGGGGAPTNATYVCIAANATLTNERVLTAGPGITITDAGPGGAVTIEASGGGGGAPTNAQYVTLATDATLTQERVLTAGAGISIIDAGAGAAVTISCTVTSVASGTAEVDFGGSPASETDVASVTIADAGVAVASELVVSLQYVATADHTADEALISEVQLLPGAITPGVGFEVHAYCPALTWGKYSINWVRS